MLIIPLGEPMADETPKFDPFKPSQPKIPGVPEKKPEPEAAEGAAPAAEKPAPAKPLPIKQIGIGVGAVVLLVLVWLVWMVVKPDPQVVPDTGSPPAAASTPAREGGAAPEPAAATPASAGGPSISLPGPIAEVNELTKPWAFKKFFIRRLGEKIPAVLVRLPSGAQQSTEGYWAISLQSPFGRCELEYVEDLDRIAGEFGYKARHAMVVDPCGKTVFDLNRYGNIGGAFTRGEVVSGSGLRPPLAIELRIEGTQIIAVRTE